MKQIIYGEGKIKTQRAKIDGDKCLLIEETINTTHPIGYVEKNWNEKHVSLDNIDIVLTFKSIEGARSLQDELNLLIANWDIDD